MKNSAKRHVAILVAAELSFLVIGGLGLAWLGADIIVRALRITLLGEPV